MLGQWKRLTTPLSFASIALVLILLKPAPLTAEQSDAHQPFRWTLERMKGNRPGVIKEVMSHGDQPVTFITSMCELVPIANQVWDPCAAKQWYGCPEDAGGHCNLPGYHYCGYWGCETVGDGKPDGGNDRFITITPLPKGCKLWKAGSRPGLQRYCEQLNITIREPNNIRWLSGKHWGFRYNEAGKDRGGFVQIRKQASLPTSLMGPNQILKSPGI